ncbi:MAG: adenylate/guanylate cyclase domain-containing protein [Chloroflexota bacterium]
MPENQEHDRIEQGWRDYLLAGELKGRYLISFQTMRNIFRYMPHDPRCLVCYAPFAGIGGAISRSLLKRRQSTMNPHLCDVCERHAREHQGGAEIELSMLFADIRGSTTIAESMSPAEFSQLINRFYQATTRVLVRHNAMIEKLIGDEVAGLFVPGLSGQEHARVAVNAAQEILSATGHGDGKEPWVPVGVGVHTGKAFVGAVRGAGGMSTISALGDAVNTAARLASEAGPGKIVVSEDTWAASGLDLPATSVRQLELKGRSEAIDARILGV